MTLPLSNLKKKLVAVKKITFLQCRRLGFEPWVRKIPWRRKWQPTPEFLSGKSHEQRSLAIVHGVTESVTTELLTHTRAHTHTHTHTPVI